MRIGFDAKRYFRNRTGLGNYSRGLVHALAEHHQADEFWLFAPGVEAAPTDFPNLKVFNAAGKGAGWRSSGIGRDLQSMGIDVYHGLSNEIPMGLKQKGLASVVTIHDVIFRRFPGYYRYFDRLMYHWKTRYAVKYADAIIATSQATADDLIRFYRADASRLHVISQPIDQDWYSAAKADNPETDPYFIYVSSFTGRKNHGTLIEAYSKISRQTDMNLVLAGATGETLEQCRRYAAHEGLTQRIRFYPDVAPDMLQALMQGAEAFIYPSLFEGFGIPLAEAAAKGKPMAVSDIGVFRELAGDAALYFNPNDAVQVGAAMLDVLRPDFRAVMQAGREKLLAGLQPQKIAGEVMAVYRSVCG